VSVAESLIHGTVSPIVLFIPPSAGLAGEVRARSDFKARGAVFFCGWMRDRWFLIRKSILGDFRKIWAQLKKTSMPDLLKVVAHASQAPPRNLIM
jgi:hypothetical protein